MKFSTREDVEAPIDQVFAQISDFDALERKGRRWGATLQRTDTMPAPAKGMAWEIDFDYRGKRRSMASELLVYEPPSALTFFSRTGGLECRSEIELMALAPRRTRVAVQIDLSPKGMSARLFLQTLRLVKSNLNVRFKKGIARYARQIEQTARQ
ncbi:SRPBCC family protein [Rhodovulum imhoffii]|nr:SRPBCC family protein [Rhodovulum imhoffii]